MRERPAWQIWAIVGGAAALVAVVGIVGIVASGKRDTDSGTGGGTPLVAAAVEQLQSHLPEELRSAQECVETAPLAYATSTVVCTWPSSHVPHTATYSLFEDDTSMNRSALTIVRSSGGYGHACVAPSDFLDSGGQMTWKHADRERGLVWCYLNRGDEPVLLWTDTAPRILASAVAPQREDAAALLEWFDAKGKASLEPVTSPPPVQRLATPAPQPTYVPPASPSKPATGSPAPVTPLPTDTPDPTSWPTAEPTAGPVTPVPVIPTDVVPLPTGT